MNLSSSLSSSCSSFKSASLLGNNYSHDTTAGAQLVQVQPKPKLTTEPAAIAVKNYNVNTCCANCELDYKANKKGGICYISKSDIELSSSSRHSNRVHSVEFDEKSNLSLPVTSSSANRQLKVSTKSAYISTNKKPLSKSQRSIKKIKF